MSRSSRRRFLTTLPSVAIGASLIHTFSFPWIRSSKLGSHPPSDQISIAVIGCRGRGFRVLRQHLDLGGLQCAALCDVDEQVLAEKADTIQKEYGHRPQIYKDFRKLLENKDIDAVIIGTPDHWHCLQTVYALQAGKHVYVEKPMANSIAECLTIVEAGKRYKPFVQVGQQQRSGKVWNEVMEFMKAGKIGHIRKTNIWANFNYGLGPIKQPNAPIPKGVDYDLYLGPAPERPFNASRFHGGWRHFWDYGGGLMTDFGAHLIDMALWVKDITTPPKTVMAYGSHLDRPDLAKETFDTMTAIFPIDDYIIQWESSAGKQVGPYGRLYGLAFLGDKGTLVVDRSGWEILPEWDNETKSHKVEAFKSEKYNGGHDLHIRDFVEAIRDNRPPVCTPEIGSNVALYAHMANIAARTKSYKLEWDNSKNKFTGNKQANALLKPSYRKPWVYPKI